MLILLRCFHLQDSINSKHTGVVAGAAKGADAEIGFAKIFHLAGFDMVPARTTVRSGGSFVCHGAGGEIRTHGLLFTKQLLYH